MDELISVIIPVYKAERYVEKCIDSIINQSYQNLEIILVDDGSPDNCGRICDEYAKKDNRIIVIHKKNEGVAEARNSGLDKASGNCIAFIDADDWIEKEYFEEMFKQLKEQKADVVLCAYNRVTGSRIEKINEKGENISFNTQEYLINSLNPQTGFGVCHTKLIKSKCLKDIKFNRDLHVGEDALFNIEISKNIQKAYIHRKVLYNYRINSDSVVKRFDENYAQKYLNAMKSVEQYITCNYKEKKIIQNYYNFVAYHVMLVAVNYCYNPKNNCNNRRKLLSEVCNNEVFKEGIEKSNYENISLTRKITLFTLKHKLYFLTSIICKYRQIQNNKS